MSSTPAWQSLLAVTCADRALATRVHVLQCLCASVSAAAAAVVQEAVPLGPQRYPVTGQLSLQVLGAGKTDGAMDAANLLKPMLARGELRCIGATTLAEYRQHMEKDAAFERRFQQARPFTHPCLPEHHHAWRQCPALGWRANEAAGCPNWRTDLRSSSCELAAGPVC